EQNQTRDAMRTISSVLDTRRSALRRAEQHDPTTASGDEDGIDVLRGRVDARVESDSVGEPGPATIEQDEAAHLGQGGQKRPTARLVPYAFDVGDEPGQHQNIDSAGAAGLKGKIDAATAGVARWGRALDLHRLVRVQQRTSLGFGRYAELVTKTPRQNFEVP